MADQENVAQVIPQPRPLPGIKPPGPLILGDNPIDNWKLYKLKWNNYAILSELATYPREYQVASLQNSLGDAILSIYTGLHFETPDNRRTTAEIIAKLEEHIIGELNETYERFVFNSITQKSDETFESFLSNCRKLILTCNFCANCKDSLLRDRLILGIHEKSTQQLLLRERNLTLTNCITICKAAENASTQMKAYKPTESINAVKHFRKKDVKSAAKAKRGPPSAKYKTGSQKVFGCKYCGNRHVMKKELCPAWGKSCSLCNKKNHFSVKCPSKSAGVHNIEEDSEEEWLNTVSVSAINTPTNALKCRLLVDDKPVKFLVDTGAAVNIIPISCVTHIENISTSKKKLVMWNHTNITPIGRYKATLENPKSQKYYVGDFTVVKEELQPLIGLETATEMNLIQVHNENMDLVAGVSADKHQAIWDDSIGTFEGEVHLSTDPTVSPVIMPSKRIPVSLKEKLKDELSRLQNLGVISPVDVPTPWVNQIAITLKKNGALRVCLDPQQLNRALLREHFQLPVLEDTLHELSNSKVFSKVDVASAYWHCKLDEESSLLTTFQTCFGRFKWNRLPFGLSVSSEIFQKKLVDNLHGLKGVIAVADDIMIHGVDAEMHDIALESLFERCLVKGIRLNKNKFEQNLKEISFMGHKITRDGLTADPEKVRAIEEFPEPRNVGDLRRFLGMCNYLGKFLPNMTEESAALRNLTKKDVPWTWSSRQKTSFNNLKKLIKSAPVLAYYDQQKALVLENDACEHGLGSVILQEGKPVAYASRSLSDPETRYAQIEKEMLAVIFGLEKFHTYTYGRQVTVVTDHKPLVAIIKKPLAKAPARLQGLLLRAQKYNLDLIYKPGKDIPIADALSRAPLDEKPHLEKVDVNNITFCPIKEPRLDSIRTASRNDPDLQVLMKVITTGWPEERSLVPGPALPYFSYRDELSVQDCLLLRGDRVIIPKSLRQEMKQKVHAGHLGINSCLRRARQLIFWPGMSGDIRQYVESCDICSTYANKQSPEPLQMSEVPSHPWEKIGTDLFTLKGRNYLITVDYFSGFFEVDSLESTFSEVIIPKLKQHMARHGIPKTLVSDGGPQYTSDSFKKFSKKYGFHHVFSSPGNSKANGAAEAAVKICKNMMRKCNVQGEDPYLGLLNIRNTPTEGMKSSPAQRLLGRHTQTPLPTSSANLKSVLQRIHDDREDLMVKKSSVADRYASRPTLKPLSVGQTIRMQPLQQGDMEWKPAKVVSQLKGRTYEVQNDKGTIYRRNRLHLRPSTPSRTPDIIESNNPTKPNPCISPAPAPKHQEDLPAKSPAKSTTPRGNITTKSGRVVKPVKRLDI